MKIYFVIGLDMFELMWFNCVCQGQYVVMVGVDCVVIVEGVFLCLCVDLFEFGMLVCVWFNYVGFFVCVIVVDIEQVVVEQCVVEVVWEQECCVCLNCVCDEVGVFNVWFVLFVVWDVGIKDVFFGLFEIFWGDGCSVVIVEYVYLLELLMVGCLVCQVGDFFCMVVVGINGKCWFFKVIECVYDGDGQFYWLCLICKVCLVLVKCWMKD